MSDSIGRNIFRLGYEISPIILVEGLAKNIPGGMLPIIAITEALNQISSLINSGGGQNLDNFFAHYVPLQGSSLISQQIATYPFANQATAANAVMTTPLGIGMLMHVPIRQKGGYALKFATMNALQYALSYHNANGGLYHIVTSAFLYLNCVMLNMVDVTGNSESHQAQQTFQINFQKPLVTSADAQQAQSSLMSKLTGETPTDGSWSGTPSTIGAPLSGATPIAVPDASNLTGATTGVGFTPISPPVPVTSAPL